jgi:ATP/maltotriose-dependent transcriptional regulator MalT
MNRFGEIADELTELMEELEQGPLSAQAKALKAALQRAVDRACEAERLLRAEEEAQPRMPQRARCVRGGANAAPAVEVSGVVIQLPRAWRVAASARRLHD